MSCVAADTTNCPNPDAPDFDIGSSPNLVKLASGKRVLTVGQKSGILWGLDPDHGGAVLWKVAVSNGGKLGGIQWGTASDGTNAWGFCRRPRPPQA